MTDRHAKRSAIEPAAELFRQEARLPNDAPRPGPIVGGTVIVLLRAVAAVLWWIGFVREWPGVISDTELAQEPATARILLIILLGFGAVWTIFLVLLARWVWRGSNTARVLVMVWTTLSITVSAIDYFVNGEEITVRTTLLTLALDILVLLALSSRDARAWARRLPR
ncbi:hypothetical protein G7068_09455 [Leucobacter viscericola]|uniref:Uncharacterized protein n=1 Tax=Leucobacter viscericola TaxID=2714935 RepID=A0A6G7XG32_9MICO|nr:hypothetical protein [Leucobacter viscericola]QIK63399.1 hypothetical protein G7068_09455 [Leucobacter viscericola]